MYSGIHRTRLRLVIVIGFGRRGGSSGIGFDCSHSVGCRLSAVADCNVEGCFHCVVVIVDGISFLIRKFL